MKKFLISFVATSFLLIILFYAFDKNSLSSKNKLNPNSGLSKLSEKGKKLLMIFLRDEMQTHLSGGDSLLDNDFESNGLTPIPVSSSKLQDDYESNEVLGDRNYRNKLLMITGKVLSINRSIGENYFISLAGGVNSVMTPQAKMKDGYIDYLSGLKKGNEISIICHGNGMLIGSAMLEECVPLDKWVDIAAKSIFESLPAMIKDKNKSMTILVLMSDIISRKLSDSSSCWKENNGELCKKECTKIIETSSKPTLNELSDAATRLGLDINLLQEVKTS